ncbi:phage tail protein [Leuconostoc citreum]|uniref:phage tail spike protein n=1 Tax=Leuconostoc citreum TaxID=33964 RepID=UPI0018892C47|nr:phage tail spike protein [Leuconostoc citreum]QOY98401.1 phage tail protein [Leuconostoc citreum]
MIYIFDKTQAIIKVLTNDDFTAAHLNFKINTATTFEFSLPASKALPSGSKYVATPHPLDDSKFIMLRLTERVDKTETIDYSAYELAYQELATDGYIEDKRPQNQSALNLMKIALDGTNWELNNVNVSGTATTNFYYVDHLSAISSVVDLLGGEIVFYIEIQGNTISGRYMDYMARQGTDTSKVFASGSNLLTVERQSDTSNIYTAILPRGKGEEIDNGDAGTPDGYGRRINIADVEWKKSSGKPLDKPKGSIILSDPDATAEWGQINGNARLLLQTYDDIDDVNVLINSAYKTLQSVNHPQIQYSATVADVGGLSLGDTVLIMHGDRDLSYKTRVFEVKYDLLAPDQTELSLGDDLSSNSITSQINSLNAVADTTSSQTQWTINQIGRPSTTFGNTEPANPKVGDVFFKELPDGGTEIYRWNGDIWELLASPTTADDIDKAVTDAVAQAQTYADQAIQTNQQNVDASIKAVDDKANQLKADQAEFDTKAQGYADQAKADAIANTTEAVQQTAKNASDALAQAKIDLTSGIAKEATDRQNAVSALDTKATNAVNQAKSDITDTLNALSVGGRNLLLDTQNPVMAVGANNVNGNFNDTGGVWTLSRGLNVAGLVKQYGSDKTITLSFDWSANGDNLSGTFNPQWNDSPYGGFHNPPIEVSSTNTSGHIVRGVSLGQNDYSTGIATAIMFRQDNLQGNVTISNIKLEIGNMPSDWTPAPEDVVLDYTTKDNQIKANISQYQTTNDGKVSKAQTDATTALGLVATKVSQTDYDKKTGDLTTKYTQVQQTVDSQATDIVDIKQTASSQASKINSISSDVDGTKQSISDIEAKQDSQSEKINQITSDVNGTKQSITDIQTKDGEQDTRMGDIEISVSGVKTDFSTYKTTNDGKVSTAQTTAQTAVDGLKTKVSQTDYDQKTGDLNTKVSTAQQTADSANTTIGDYKKANDDRISIAESSIKQNANAISSKVSQSDYNTKTGQIDTALSKVDQKADSINQTVSQVSGRIDDLQVGGRNLLLDTENSVICIGNNNINGNFDQYNAYWNLSQNLTVGGLVKKYGINRNIVISFNWSANGDNLSGTFNPQWNDSPYGGLVTEPIKISQDNRYGKFVNTISLGANGFSDGVANAVKFRQDNLNGTITITDIKLEIGNMPSDWTPAPEDIDNKFSTQQQKIDSITSIVSDPDKGLTTRVQTAEGFMTKATDRLGKVENISSNTADGLTREIKDRSDGDTNFFQQGKDFTTSQISNSESGMKSFINQTIEGLQIGTISNDVSSLKSQVNWQQVSFDDMNYMNVTGNFLVTSGAGANSPFTPWFYIKVDAPRADRITQTIWKDLDSTQMFRRTFDGTNWSAWSQVVSSSTLLNIFHDSWSLGTSTNDGITKQMVTGIMGQPDGTLILKGNSLILDGDTTVTGDFYAKGGNFKNLNASNMTVGTLNGTQVNITNINANNIVSGSISGANLNINLNTGQVVFQKGRIYNEGVQAGGAGIDVNIDQRYISTSNGYSSSVLRNGMMMLYQSTLVNSGKDPYFQIDNFGTQLTLEGARLRGSKNISLSVYNSSDVPVFSGASGLNGAVFSDGYAARIEGKDKGVKISGGAAFGSISPASPNILVGVDPYRSNFGGNRIAVNANYFYLLNQYATTTSSGANMFITDDGAVIRSSSSSKYKLNITYDQSGDTANKLLTIDPALWHDKFESEQLDKFHETGVEPEHSIDMDNRWYYGIIAEDLVKAGLEHLVIRNTKTGSVEGVEYSKIGVSLIPIIRELRNMVLEQKVEIERLKEK